MRAHQLASLKITTKFARVIGFDLFASRQVTLCVSKFYLILVTSEYMFNKFPVFFLQQQTMDFPNGVIGVPAWRRVAVERSHDSEHAKNRKRVWVHRKRSEIAELKTAVRFLYNILRTR